MEDSVVRKTVLTSMTAALCAVGAVVNAAEESSGWSPLTALKAPWTWATQHKKTPEQSTTVLTPAQPQAAAPSKAISPLKHPVKYLGVAMSETPIARGMGFGAAKKSIELQDSSLQASDSISLSTPTGPPSPQLFITMAEVAERQGNVAQSRTQLQQALSMWPGNVDVLRAAARLEDRQGQLPLAEILYRQVVAQNLQDAAAHNDLGLCLARQGKLEESVQEIEQAIHLQPDKPLYRNNVATVLIELRQDQKALAHLSAVHGLAEANYNLGQLMVQRGRQQEALVYFQVALAQNPSLRQAETSIAMLQRNGVGAHSPAAMAAQPGVAPYGSQPAPQVASPQPAGAPAAAPGTTDRYGMPDRYSGPAVNGTPATTDYRASLPRHLPPVGSGTSQWTQ
jgi:tetratricopeptide (TPR) repeat protein